MGRLFSCQSFCTEIVGSCLLQLARTSLAFTALSVFVSPFCLGHAVWLGSTPGRGMHRQRSISHWSPGWSEACACLRVNMGWGHAQLVECLPHTHKAWVQSPAPHQKQNKTNPHNFFQCLKIGLTEALVLGKVRNRGRAVGKQEEQGTVA